MPPRKGKKKPSQGAEVRPFINKTNKAKASKPKVPKPKAAKPKVVQPAKPAPKVQPVAKPVKTPPRPMLWPEGVSVGPQDYAEKDFWKHRPAEKPTVDSIRKRAILDLFVTPWTLGSTTIGITLLLLSWALGGGAVMTFLGFLGVLIGVGWAGTNFALNLESVVQNAAKSIELETREAVKKRLDDLDTNLCKDRDPRDQTYLRDMRELFDAFVADYDAGNFKEFCTSETVGQIKELFNAVVKKLEAAYKIWESSRNLRGPAKDLAQADRDKIIEDVGKAVEHMGEVISGIRSLTTKAETGDLDRLRDNLDRQLNAARRTQERMEGLNQELHERQ